MSSPATGLLIHPRPSLWHSLNTLDTLSERLVEERLPCPESGCNDSAIKEAIHTLLLLLAVKRSARLPKAPAGLQPS